MSNAIPERPDPDAGAGASGGSVEPGPTPAAPAFPPASPFAAPSGPYGPQGPFGSPPAGRPIDGRPIDGYAGAGRLADPSTPGYQGAADQPGTPGYPGATDQQGIAGYQGGDPAVSGYLADPAVLGPIPGPWPLEPVAPKGPLDTVGARSLVALGVAAFVALLGFPLGWLWESIVPRVPVVRQGQDFFYADPYGEQRAAQEGWFILLSIGVGIVLAIGCWVLLRRFRGAPMAFALGLGGTVAGWLAWRFGHTIGYAHNLALQRVAKDGQIVYLPPDLRVKQKGDIAFWHHLPYISGVLLYLGIAALVTYLLLVSFTAYPDLRPRRRVRGQQAPEATPAE